MITSIVSWVAFAVVIVFLFMVLLRARALSNRILVVSSKEFFEACESLMTSSDELPNIMIEFLETMNASALDDSGHRFLLTVVTNGANGKSFATRMKSDIDNSFSSMRPELRDLFKKAVISWFNYLMHQNLFTMIRIMIQLQKLKSAGLDQAKDETAGMNCLQSLNADAC